VYHALLRIHELVSEVGVFRLLASGGPMTAGADDGGLRFCPVSALFGGIATLIVIVSLPPHGYKDISLG
jgi:hypothetical protein